MCDGIGCDQILGVSRGALPQSGSEDRGQEDILEEEGRYGTTFLSIKGFQTLQHIRLVSGNGDVNPVPGLSDY